MATRQLLVLASLLAAAAAACGSDRPRIAIGPPPAKATAGQLAGPLCNPDGCTCMTSPAEAGAPEAPGLKRFEIRLGPTPHDLWATVSGRVLYKSSERPEMCFYVDLEPGAHVIDVRASQPSGVSAAIAIAELGTATRSAYDTFRFSCGSPGGVCSYEELDGKKAEYQAARNAHDPCGSAKAKQVAWDTRRSPDQPVPSELAMRFVLQIYKFQPDKPHGDPTCGAGDGRRRRDGAGTDGEPPATPPAGS